MANYGPTTTVTKYRATKKVTKTLNLNCGKCHLLVSTKSVRWGEGPAVKTTKKKATKTVTSGTTTTTVYQCKTSPWS
ncbi:hypothetical protein H072_2388 [Dactylellina haptotyla CBS 200.50]|uniref:Uncharacterized protein n=1 Tax=Dactylellina haptotyla (strain CBS 200.50) TaxID=1284197 RepID=S8AKU8_DACHA|nr:hypothetical protein H072_2388 [Dactylellina haptotyla CBS 200.50]